MARVFLLSIIVLLTLGAHTSAAQWAVRVAGGGIVPVSPDVVQHGTNPGVGAELGIQIPLTAWLSVSPSVTHHRFETNDNRMGGDGTMAAWSGTVGFRVDVPLSTSRVRLYVMTGSGVYHLSNVPDQTPVVCVVAPCPPFKSVDDPGFQPGIQLGIGASVPVTHRFHFFVEPTYVHIFGGGRTTNEQNRDVTSVPLRLGLLVRL